MNKSRILKVCIIGGAGFIGSALARRLVTEVPRCRITIFDNFSSGTAQHLAEIVDSPKVTVIRGDVKDLDSLCTAVSGSDQVWHFASNPDIAKAVSDPEIDFREGTFLTNNVLEAMRRTGASHLIYASGSGVYGETGLNPVTENHAPMHPISTYGSSKLAGEALICAYCHMFDMNARAYRFANVVGPRQTHGVGYDFVRRLARRPNVLNILGDGTQSKSYIFVDDVLDAIWHTENHAQKPFDVFNVATDDYITVTEIADLALEVCGLTRKEVHFEYAGGKRGWKGDVPVVRFDLQKIHRTGWQARLSSRDALKQSMTAMLREIEKRM